MTFNLLNYVRLLVGKHNSLTPNFTVMRRVLNFIKKAGNVYVRIIAKSQMMTPTGAIPIPE